MQVSGFPSVQADEWFVAGVGKRTKGIGEEALA